MVCNISTNNTFALREGTNQRAFVSTSLRGKYFLLRTPLKKSSDRLLSIFLQEEENDLSTPV